MIDEFDYKEPSCVLCEGKEFYYPETKSQSSSIPIPNIINKLDSLLNKEEYSSAKNLLDYWVKEAIFLNDKRGELSIQNEILGLSRRINDKDWGINAVNKCLKIIEDNNYDNMVSVGTIYLNLATTLKAFGKPLEALQYYKKAENVYDLNLGKDDALYAGLYNNNALCLVDLEKFDEALSLFSKAIKIMKTKKNGMLDVAISYVNMADLVNKKNHDEILIKEYLDKALDSLNDKSNIQDGYYAFVCRKCAPTFGYYGYFLVKKDLNERADKIYERNRISL